MRFTFFLAAALVLIPAAAEAGSEVYTVNGVPVASSVINNDGTASASSNLLGIHLNSGPGHLSGQRNSCLGVPRCKKSLRLGNQNDYANLNQ